MKGPLPFKRRGEVLRAHEDWNEVVSRVNSLTNRLGTSSGQFPLGPIYAKVMTEGPSAEADYDDERYWIKRVIITNNDGDQTARTTWDHPTNAAYHMTATNLAEHETRSHAVPSDSIVYAWPLPDARVTEDATPPTVYWVFSQVPPAWRPARVTDDSDDCTLTVKPAKFVGTSIEDTALAPLTARFLPDLVAVDAETGFKHNYAEDDHIQISPYGDQWIALWQIIMPNAFPEPEDYCEGDDLEPEAGLEDCWSGS
jgi:hypothetical protein